MGKKQIIPKASFRQLAPNSSTPLCAGKLCSLHGPTLQVCFMISFKVAMIHLIENNSSRVALARITHQPGAQYAAKLEYNQS